MKTLKCLLHKSISILLIIIMAMSVLIPVTAFAAEETSFRAAKIDDLKGDVTVLRSGGEKSFSAFKGMSLSQGDTLTTGKDSWANLYIDDDKEVKIDQKTKINMSELGGSLVKKNESTGIKLWFGKVFASIKKKLNVRSKFEIKTPTTVAGARGTQFFVGQEDGRTDIAVLEGTVAATAYVPQSSQPGENTPGGDSAQQQEVEVVIQQNQQVTLDPGVLQQQGQPQVQVQQVTAQSLDLFVLQTIQEIAQEQPASLPAGLNPALLQNLDQVIRERQTEQQQQEQQRAREEQAADAREAQERQAAVVRDPEVAPPPPPPPAATSTPSAPTTTTTTPQISYVNMDVLFPDDNLVQAICTGLVKPKTGITTSDLRNITNLEWSYKQGKISNLTGIQNLPNLTSLSLNQNLISDLSPLQQLTHLETLSLYQNQIPDTGLVPLTHLSHLKSLDLSWQVNSSNQKLLSNINILGNITSLEYLGLGGNAISSISGLSGLNQLRDMNLSYQEGAVSTYLQDILPTLQDMDHLRYLVLNGNNITNLTGITSLTGLEKLYIQGNQITELPDLSSLSLLDTLDISYNHISALSPIQGLSVIKNLYASNNYLDDNRNENLQAINQLENLEILGLQCFNSDRTPEDGLHTSELYNLRNLKHLRELNVANNDINEMHLFGLFTELQVLNVSENRITSLSELINPNIYSLNVRNNDIESIHPLMRYYDAGNSNNQLMDIELQGNPIRVDHAEDYVMTQGNYTDCLLPSKLEYEGSSIRLKYVPQSGAVLDTSSIPDKTQFSVRINNNAVVTPDSVQMNGDTITLSMAAPISAGSKVYLNYQYVDMTGNHPVQTISQYNTWKQLDLYMCEVTDAATAARGIIIVNNAGSNDYVSFAVPNGTDSIEIYTDSEGSCLLDSINVSGGVVNSPLYELSSGGGMLYISYDNQPLMHVPYAPELSGQDSVSAQLDPQDVSITKEGATSHILVRNLHGGDIVKVYEDSAGTMVRRGVGVLPLNEIKGNEEVCIDNLNGTAYVSIVRKDKQETAQVDWIKSSEPPVNISITDNDNNIDNDGDNENDSDYVYITNMDEGDVIRVYDAQTDGNLIGWGMCGRISEWAIAEVKDGLPANFYVSITKSDDKAFESIRVSPNAPNAPTSTLSVPDATNPIYSVNGADGIPAGTSGMLFLDSFALQVNTSTDDFYLDVGSQLTISVTNISGFTEEDFTDIILYNYDSGFPGILKEVGRGTMNMTTSDTGTITFSINQGIQMNSGTQYNFIIGLNTAGWTLGDSMTFDSVYAQLIGNNYGELITSVGTTSPLSYTVCDVAGFAGELTDLNAYNSYGACEEINVMNSVSFAGSTLTYTVASEQSDIYITSSPSPDTTVSTFFGGSEGNPIMITNDFNTYNIIQVVVSEVGKLDRIYTIIINVQMP